MIIPKLLIYSLLLVCFASCGTSSNKETTAEAIEQNPIDEKSSVDNTENIELIKKVYSEFVFAIDGDKVPETYFTTNAMKKLQDDYEFDCDDEPCYAFYALRTEMQDANPESDGSSQVLDVAPDVDDWYVVSYSDMGWLGKTRVKIKDGKIDDYQRLKQ